MKRPYRNRLYGFSDAFAAKVAPGGESLVYSTYLGGSHDDLCNSIAVDAQGAAVLAGYTGSPNFPVKAAFQKSLGGKKDGFIAKLTPAGNGIIYSSYMGGSATDEIWDIVMDGTGAVYIAGFSDGTFPVKNAFQSTRKGMNDAFVAKIASNGRSVIYSSYLGGIGHDHAIGIDVDGSGTAYVAGFTMSHDFPVKSPFQASRLGSQDAFLTLVDPSGAKLLHSTYLGGIYKDYGWGVALGGDGAIYLSGTTNSPDFPMKGAYQGTLAGDYDAFVFKFTQGSAGRRKLKTNRPRLFPPTLYGGGQRD
jgi:hypothetical protein